MNFLNEYALLVVVALPVAVIFGMNFFLALNGEEGTLLLPTFASYPSLAVPSAAETSPAAPVAAVEPSNDERMLEAA